MNKICQKNIPAGKNPAERVFGALRGTASGAPGARGRNSLPSGFTLIELLVTVLIIGLLAAAALPQYETAVEKSRAAEPLAILRSIRDAQEVYYMANGVYAEDLTDLDVRMPVNSKYWRYRWSGISVAAYRQNISADKQYLLAYRVGTVVSGGHAALVCGYNNVAAASFAEHLCKVLGASAKESSNRWILAK